MKNLIAANWKSNMRSEDCRKFFEYLTNNQEALNTQNTEILICPPYTLLSAARQYVSANSSTLLLGAQNCSAFPEGAYTGEIAASQVKEYAEYVIIGHSERRENFNETEEIIELKITHAKNSGLQVVLCVQDEHATVCEGVDTVAYEPVSAIGTGEPADPVSVTKVLNELHERYPKVRLLYGGSVDKNSIHNYVNIPHLNGFLVGGASLDAESFLHLIAACDTKNSQ